MSYSLGSDEDLIREYWTPESGDLCLDVGCGPGYWTCEAARRGATCYGFDPDPHAVMVARRHCLTHARGRWGYIVCIGISNHFSLQAFRGKVLKDSDDREDSHPVLCVALDNLSFPRLDFMNLDVEGHEAEVIEGARGLLDKWHPRLVVEVHAGVDRAGLRSYLESVHGYNIREYRTDHLIADYPGK